MKLPLSILAFRLFAFAQLPDWEREMGICHSGWQPSAVFPNEIDPLTLCDQARLALVTSHQ